MRMLRRMCRMTEERKQNNELICKMYIDVASILDKIRDQTEIFQACEEKIKTNVLRMVKKVNVKGKRGKREKRKPKIYSWIRMRMI